MVTADTSQAASGPPARTGPSLWLATLIFVALTAVLTWPQVIHFGSVPENVDSYFSLWRLAWVAHALPLDPRHLFDANIFFPARHTLAFSDAVLLPAAIAAPFLWFGIPVVFVYNGLVLGSFVLCGVGTFLLVRDLTGRPEAALVSGIIFAFVPFRFDHYFHLELLWAHWIPLTLWALHRTVESGRLGWGFVTGLFSAALGLSCIYYTVFLATVFVVVVPVLVISLTGRRRRAAARALAAGALLAAVIVVPYVLPYDAARAELGDRPPGNAVLYGAGPKHYIAAMPGSLVWGSLTGGIGTHEKRLFPGAIAILLAVIGLSPTRLRPRPPEAGNPARLPGRTETASATARSSVGQGFSLAGVRVAYLLMLAVALDISFGHRGLLFNVLREYEPFYRGLRVPARVAVLVLLSVAVLAGVGASRVARWCERTRPRWRTTVVACLVGLVVAEYLVAPLSLVAVPITRGEVYRWLRQQPVGVVAELPMPMPGRPQLQDGVFEYLSTFHWRPLLNGYSGNTPASYDFLLKKVKDFPAEDALTALRTAGAQYLLVHERLYGGERYASVTRSLDRRGDLEGYGPFDEDGFAVRAYRVLPVRTARYTSSSSASSARSMMKRNRAEASRPISSLITRSVTI